MLQYNSYYKTGILVLICWLFIASCGKDDDKNEEGGMGASSIVGEWISDCLAAGDEFELKSITFTEKTFKFSSGIYSDESCSTLSDSIDGEGEFDLGALVNVPYVGDTTEIDYTFTHYNWTFTATPKEAVDVGVACDAEVSGNIVNVLGKSCTFSGSEQIDFYSPAYGVIFIDNNGKLLLSDTSSNGGTKETRSTLLRINAGWSKVTESPEGS